MPSSLSRVAHQLLQMDELSRKDTSEKKGRREEKNPNHKGSKPHVWTDPAIQLLKKLWPDTETPVIADAISDLLGKRVTPKAVSSKATYLDLSRSPTFRRNLEQAKRKKRDATWERKRQWARQIKQNLVSI